MPRTGLLATLDGSIVGVWRESNECHRTRRTSGGRRGPRNRPRRTPKGRQVDPQALDEVRALLGDRSRRRDLLIEHLHLIQDQYGHISRRASRRARRRDEARADRGLRGRDLLRAFRRGEGRRAAAAAGHRARVRLAVLRDGGRRASARRICRHARPGRARRARALHGRLRPRAGLRGRPRAGVQGRRQSKVAQPRRGHDARACLEHRRPISPPIMAAGGYRAARRLPSPASARATS